MTNRQALVLAIAVWMSSSAFVQAQSIARVWDEEILAAIRIDKPHPPVHARNLFTLSAAIYDGWAAYDPVAVGYVYRSKHAAADLAAARRETISYAAYRVLKERFGPSLGSNITLPALDARMASLGYDTNYVSLDTASPAGIGNLIAAAVSAWFMNDGARQSQGYADAPSEFGGYAPANPSFTPGDGGAGDLQDVNRWAPLLVTISFGQNGTFALPLQSFLGSQWLNVRPFGLTRLNPALPWFDPGPPPRLNTSSDTEFRANVVAVIRASSELTSADQETIDIGPGGFGNNPLGTNDGQGRQINPVTGKPYAPNRVYRGDFARVIAEFWADGPNSETPPGHWNTIANKVADTSGFEKRLGGTGPVVDDLEWDVKVYFALNAALHDAACAAWSLKRYYDGWRPISAIRYMGILGQSSDPKLPAYHTNGLPLVPGLIELTTTNSAAPGGRHEGHPTNAIVLKSWRGNGVGWVDARWWVPYQRETFVTPAFPGYVSGHSTFSRAAAEVLAGMTGSAFFPGGVGSYRISTNSLQFDSGPAKEFDLQWATYYDAADQAGLSRIWGGIHPPADDLTGRRIGAECGTKALQLAGQYFNGSIFTEGVTLEWTQVKKGQHKLSFSTSRGFFYSIETSSDAGRPFTRAALVQANDTSISQIMTNGGGVKLIRVLKLSTPQAP